MNIPNQLILKVPRAVTFSLQRNLGTMSEASKDSWMEKARKIGETLLFSWLFFCRQTAKQMNLFVDWSSSADWQHAQRRSWSYWNHRRIAWVHRRSLLRRHCSPQVRRRFGAYFLSTIGRTSYQVLLPRADCSSAAWRVSEHKSLMPIDRSSNRSFITEKMLSTSSSLGLTGFTFSSLDLAWDVIEISYTPFQS